MRRENELGEADVGNVAADRVRAQVEIDRTPGQRETLATRVGRITRLNDAVRLSRRGARRRYRR